MDTQERTIPRQDSAGVYRDPMQGACRRHRAGAIIDAVLFGE